MPRGIDMTLKEALCTGLPFKRMHQDDWLYPTQRIYIELGHNDWIVKTDEAPDNRNNHTGLLPIETHN